MPPDVRTAICTLRRVHPDFEVERIVEHVSAATLSDGPVSWLIEGSA
jgi:hypothetical protein